MADWPGVLDRDPSTFKQELIEESDRLADSARTGQWRSVFRILSTTRWLSANWSRVGGSAWYTPLHQAAWQGASVDVVEELIGLGAWRTLRESSGQRSVDLARERRHDHLVEVLTPQMTMPDDPELFAAWDRHLAAVVEGRIRPQLSVRLRHVTTEVLADTGLEGPLWFAIPGMYGGFALHIDGDHVVSSSWSRVVGGSGQEHHISRDGAVLVREGFV